MGCRNWLVFSAGNDDIPDFSVDKITLRFLCGRRKLFVSGVWIEINSVFASGHRDGLDTRVGIQIDLISVMGSN